MSVLMGVEKILLENLEKATYRRVFMENQTVQVRVERYEELIKKEALLDKLMEGKSISVYLFENVDIKEGDLNA